MKIALINPPISPYKLKSAEDFFYLAGVAQIEADLRDNYDIKTVNLEHDRNATLRDVDDCDIVGVSANFDCYRFFKETLPPLKKKGKIIIIGGSLISSYGFKDNLLMRVFPEIDYAVIGEGESSTRKLIEHIEGRAIIPNRVIYRQDGELRNTKSGQLVQSLDDLPIINPFIWRGFPEAVKGHVTNFMSSRGCYNNPPCSFCFKEFPGVRSFSLPRIDKELGNIAKMQPRRLWLSDDTFTYDKKRAIDIGKLAQKHGLKYFFQTRASDADLDLMKAMKRTGCELVCIGIESFDDNLREASRKRIAKEQIYQAVKNIREAGLDALAFFIVGLPGENRESLETTIRFAEESGVIPRARLLIPLPGTEVYRQGLKQGKIDELSLLERFSEISENALSGDIVSINLSEGLSDKELIEARNRLNSIR